MRFAFAEPDSDDYAAVAVGYSSDESDHVPDFSRHRMSKLGQTICDFLAESDSDSDSDSDDEIEVGDILAGGHFKVVGTPAWRNARKEKGDSQTKVNVRESRRDSFINKSSSSIKHSSISKGWRHVRLEPSVAELLNEQHPEYSEWIKQSEAEAWKDGQRVAGERTARMHKIKVTSKRDSIAVNQEAKDAEAEEMRKLMEGLAVKSKKEDENIAKKFAEREAKLWSDVDAAIKAAVRRQAEDQAAAAAEARRIKAEETARIAAEEKAALERKAQSEREAKEKAEKEAAEQAERERAEAEAKAREASAKAEADKREAASAEDNRSAIEWAKWVEVQKQMKADVINVVKSDRDMTKTLRQSTRMLTRKLGQVVNSRPNIVRIIGEVHDILISQLPSAPTPSDPISFDMRKAHIAYFYLLSHVTKSLIKQAESEVSANLYAAHPLARVAVGLLLRGHGALGEILMARLVKKCPFVVPFCPQRAPGQARGDYEKSTGRLSDETRNLFVQRMGGIVMLYFSVVLVPYSEMAATLDAPLASAITPQTLSALIPVPFRLPSAWTWLATMLRGNLPGALPSAHLIVTMVDVTGNALLKTYGHKQIAKVIDMIKVGSDNGSIKGDSPASRARIDILAENFKRDGKFKDPKDLEWRLTEDD